MKSAIKKSILLVMVCIVSVQLTSCKVSDSVSQTGLSEKAELFGNGTAHDPVTGEKYPKEINIAVVEGGAESAILMKEDYFHSMGIKVNAVAYTAGTEINNAMVSGSIDMASFGLSPVVLGIVRGIPYKVVYVPYIQGGNIEALVAKKELGAENLSDLRGKTIGAPFGTTSHYALLNALKLESLSLEEVTILDMGGQDIVAAWKRGDIDAAYIWSPALNECQKDGIILVNDGMLAEQGLMIPEIAVANTSFSEKYPTLVSQYVRALMDVYELVENDPDQAVKDVSDWEGISLENAKVQVLDNIWISGEEQLLPKYLGNKVQKGALAKILKEAADFHLEQGDIRQSPDIQTMEEAIDPSFVDRALQLEREGETKSWESR